MNKEFPGLISLAIKNFGDCSRKVLTPEQVCDKSVATMDAPTLEIYHALRNEVNAPALEMERSSGSLRP